MTLVLLNFEANRLKLPSTVVSASTTSLREMRSLRNE